MGISIATVRDELVSLRDCVFRYDDLDIRNR